MRAANCMRDYGTTNNTPAHQAPPVWRAPEGLEDLTAAQVGDGGACQHTNDKPDRSGAPRGLQGLAGLRDRPLRAQLACGDLAGGTPPTGTHSGPAQQNKPRGGRAWPGIEPTRRAPSAANAQLVWRTSEGPAAVPVGGGRAWPGFETTRRANHQHTRLHLCGGHRGARPRCRWAAAGPGRASRSTTPSEARVWRSRGRDAAHRHQHAGTNTQPQTHRHNEAARPHRGPGGSRVRPLGGHQRRVQRIWVPVAPRRSQASTTRAAMPASADLPHVRGSYCFFTPTSPSILRTPS